ncbi:hypothetical protein Taro_026820 [Colocasia esculenta]|uniref:Uncharacterized protein n=1 Tax=Colocasia esculenta TaxID=4460 RepID=A0A843VI94_COLES|nr:hypothetical protein [Colocasia esculenta]
MCATCNAQGSGHWEGDAQVRCDLVATPRCVAESGKSKGNAGRSLHSLFFAKVVDTYRGYLSSWVPQVLLTSEAHPYSPQARARRRFLYRRPVQSPDVVVLAQPSSSVAFLSSLVPVVSRGMPQACCVVSLARLWPVRGRRTRVKHVIGLTGLDEAFRRSWYQSKAVVMADRRDWGGGGDDPEESTHRMIERIWESLTDIRMKMNQQAPVPLVIGEVVPMAPVPPPPGVEVPFVAPVPPSPPVIAVEEPVVQVESAADKKGAVQNLAARWDFSSEISDAVHGTEQLKKQPREQLLLREQFRLVRWASQVRVVSGYPSSQRV